MARLACADHADRRLISASWQEMSSASSPEWSHFPYARPNRARPLSTAGTGFPCTSEDIVLIRRAATAAVLATGLAIAGAPAALATPTVSSEAAAPLAGLRAYFVITAPNDTAGAKAAI